MDCLDHQHLHPQVEDYSDLIHPLRLILQVVASLVDQNRLSKILLEDCLEQHSNRTLHLLAVGCLDQPQLQEAAYLAPLLSQQAVVFLDKQHNPTKEMQEVYLDSLQHQHQEACLDKQLTIRQHLEEVFSDKHSNQVCLGSKPPQDKLQRGLLKAV